MTRPISISADPAAGWAVRKTLRAAAVTLPETFHLTDVPGEIVVVDGGTGWPERTLAAIGSGAQAVLVIDPGAARPEALQSVIRSDIPVVLDAPWRHNATVQRMTSYFQAFHSAGSMLEAGTAVQVGDDLRTAITQLAFTGQALIGTPITNLRDVVSTPDHLTVFGDASGLLIRLSAVVGPGPVGDAWFRLVGHAEIAAVQVPSSLSGATGVGTFVEPGLRTTVEAAFESTHRTALAYIGRVLQERLVPTDVADLLQLVASSGEDTILVTH